MNYQEFVDFLKNSGLEGLRKYYSVYFGIVQGVSTDSNTNTLIVVVPEVFGTNRAIPASPRGVPSGKGWGYNFVPKRGENVLITFRYGSPRFPLWEPGFYAEGEKPEEFNENIIGHKYRDGSISLYDEENHEFRVKTPNGTILTHKDNLSSFMVPEGITLTADKDKFEFTLNNGDNFKYEQGTFKVILASGPRIQLGSSGVRLAGHGAFSNAVLGEPLVIVLAQLCTVLVTILPILTSHDVLVAGANASQISTLTTTMAQISSSLNSILAT